MSSTSITVTDSDPACFLTIAGQGAGVSTHAGLWRWLQGDVQQWLTHDVRLIGCGEFRSGELQFDIVSSLPGMRSHRHLTSADIGPLISYLRDCCQFAVKNYMKSIFAKLDVTHRAQAAAKVTRVLADA